MLAADGSRSIPAADDEGAAMLSGLRVAHRLLLIYLLSFASVAYLAYTLVVEKNISIEFARKELRGIGYVDVVRQVLLPIIRDEGAAAGPQPGDNRGGRRTVHTHMGAPAPAGRENSHKPKNAPAPAD